MGFHGYEFEKLFQKIPIRLNKGNFEFFSSLRFGDSVKEVEMATVDSLIPTQSERDIPVQTGNSCCMKRGMKRGIFCPRKKCSRSSDYRVCLDLKQFKAEDIKIRTKEMHIIVEAKKDSEEFAKKYELPEGYDPSTVTSFLNSKGKLMIRAGKGKIEETGEKFVSIEQFEAEDGASDKDEDFDDGDEGLDTEEKGKKET